MAPGPINRDSMERNGSLSLNPLSTPLVVCTALLTLRKQLNYFIIYPTRDFLNKKLRKYTDRFYVSPILHKENIPHTLFYSTLMFSFHNVPWKPV